MFRCTITSYYTVKLSLKRMTPEDLLKLQVQEFNKGNVSFLMTLLLDLVGMSVGPALAGIFQEMNQGAIQGVPGLFPTESAYNPIFMTAALVSLASVAMAYSIVKGKITTPAIMTTNHQKQSRNSTQSASCDHLKAEYGLSR
jgi:hypothetical protein